MAAVLVVGVVLMTITWVTGHRLRRLALAAASGAGTSALAYVAAVMFLLVTGFVDERDRRCDLALTGPACFRRDQGALNDADHLEGMPV